MCRTCLVRVYLQSSWNKTSGTRPLRGQHVGNQWSKQKGKVGLVNLMFMDPCIII